MRGPAGLRGDWWPNTRSAGEAAPPEVPAPCRVVRADAGHRPAARDRTTADQSIRWARFTMNPSGPRTDAMRQLPSY
jgi:hypothetical protein